MTLKEQQRRKGYETLAALFGTRIMAIAAPFPRVIGLIPDAIKAASTAAAQAKTASVRLLPASVAAGNAVARRLTAQGADRREHRLDALGEVGLVGAERDEAVAEVAEEAGARRN